MTDDDLSEYVKAMRELMRDESYGEDDTDPHEIEKGDYECTKCGWTTDIDDAFRTRERNWCKVDKDIQWFKKLT